MPCIEIEACIRSVNQMLERANKLRDEYQTKVIEVDIDVAPKVKTLDHIISFPELRSLDLLCVEVLRRLLEQDAAAIVSRWHVNENTGFSSPQEVVNELEGKLVLLKHASSLSKTRKARAPDMVRGGYLTMASDDRDQGRKWVENEIAKAAAERGVALAGPIEWHKDFDRMLYWIEAVFDDSRKRWKFSYEQLEDCVNDKGVQRELKKAIGFFVSNASTQVLDRPEQQPLSQDRSAAARSHALRVFLCHSKSDKPAVRLLHSKLLSIGIHPWFDEEDLLPGQDWELTKSKFARAMSFRCVFRRRR